VGIAFATSVGARAQTVDPTFNPAVANGTIEALVIQPDGKILIGGPTARGKIERLNADGSVDTGFTPPHLTLIAATVIALQADGKILIGGHFVNMGACFHICRLNSDGTPDTGFNPGADFFVWDIAVQADGKIVVGGAFTMLGGGGSGTTARNHIARLNPDGSLDTSFDPGTNDSGSVSAVAVQPDGKILVGGEFTGLGGGTGTTPRRNIGRLNPDGSVDASFDPGANDAVREIALQADGKILVAGFFTMLGGGGTGTTARQRIGRLNANGSLDAGFDPGANADIRALVAAPDGTILAGGDFTTIGGGGSGTTRNRIARLDAGGAVDTGFDPGANNTIYAMAVQADGSILVGGSFTMLGGGGTGTTPRNRIGRLLVAPAPPSIATHPSNQTVKVGRTATFSSTATGSPNPTVRWQVSTNSGSTWDDVAGATSTTYAFTVAQADDGKWFRAVFTNGSGQAESNAASLVVQPLVLPVVTLHPANQTAKVNKVATFVAAASDCTLSAWEISTNNGSSWESIGGLGSCTPATFEIFATPALGGALLRAVFSNPDGSVTTDAASLTVRSVSGSDFNGDGTTDIAVYRRTTGFWYVGNQPWVQYGGPGYVPVAGDYNGDGTTDIAVYQPSSGTWFVRNQFWTQFGDPGDIPVPGDYDGNGTTDIAVYRPSTGGWYVRNQLGITGFGGPGDIPVVGDYNGDGTADIAVYRPSTGVWYVRGQFYTQFGEPGEDIPVPGDYNRDDITDIAVYRPSLGFWRVRDQFTLTFGSPGDVPVPRDFDGDADTDIAVYRPSTGHWFVRNQVTVQFGDAMDVPVPRAPSTSAAINGDYDADRVTNLAVYTASTGLWRVRNGLEVVFGEPLDQAVPADYNGDGTMDLAIYRPSTGTWDVRDQFTVDFGVATDIPVPGDYDGDGLADVVVYRPSTGFWFILNRQAVHFGDTGDVPVPGDYNGDGRIDIAVYRPSTGYWYVRNQTAVQFGAAATVPVPGDYNGDGTTDLAFVDTAAATWHIRGYPPIAFGDPTDTPVPGDYDGDGTTDIAVYRPSTGEWIVRNQFTVVFGDPGDVPVVRVGGNR
jgi:uncharacterized delta-60 repeat protein